MARWAEPRARSRALCEIVTRLCRQLGLPVPALTYDDSEEINAGVTGTGPHDAVLYFSGGALAKLTGPEAAAVAAHELAHIAARDFGDQFVPSTVRLPLVRWLADWVWLVRWTILKRRREYAADSLAAALVGEDALISALRKTALDTLSPARPWLATHPHPRRRIRALETLRRARSRRCTRAGNQPAGRVFSKQV